MSGYSSIFQVPSYSRCFPWYFISGWWFGTCFIFPFSWEFHDPNWLSTNQNLMVFPSSITFHHIFHMFSICFPYCSIIFHHIPWCCPSFFHHMPSCSPWHSIYFNIFSYISVYFHGFSMVFPWFFIVFPAFSQRFQLGSGGTPRQLELRGPGEEIAPFALSEATGTGKYGM